MKGDFHVRFRENAGVKLPCVTRLVAIAFKKMRYLRQYFILTLILSWINVFSQTNPDHVYVRPYIKNDGTFVQGHYRTKANETNIDNFSTLGNINPYTGKPGWIPPDTYYPTSYSDQYIDLGLESLKAGDYYQALKYSDKVTDSEIQNLIRFRAYHGAGDFKNSLYYAKAVRNQTRDFERTKTMDEWIQSLELMIEATNELEIKTDRYNRAIESADYKTAISEASTIKSILLNQIKYIYLAYAYEMDRQYQDAINYYNQCIHFESDSETIKGYRTRIEFCEKSLKYPKANTNLKFKDIVEILLFHAKDEYSDLDNYLREYGFKISDLKNKSIKIGYERITDNPEKIELLIFVEDIMNDSTKIKIVSLEHSSYEYKKQLEKDFKYYRYRKDNVTGPLSNFVGNEYAFESLILFDGVRTNASEMYIFGGYLFITNKRKVLTVDLSKYDTN